MSEAQRKLELDGRLQAHFATVQLHRPANWQIYAAVTGSAMAMATNMSAAAIADLRPQNAAQAFPGTQQLATLKTQPMLGAVRSAMARLDAPQTALNQPPTILPNGVVPVFSTTPTIQPGEWISIYGSNLASTTANWNGDFPITLGGTSVTINGKSAYLVFVSPGQINLQAPDDTARGTVPVVVTTGAGSATTTVTLSTYAPSFDLQDGVHVAGIILRPRNNGAYGGGAYDILGPTGTFNGVTTVAAQPGDAIELFAVGFGPTMPLVPAGQAFTGSVPLSSPFDLYVNDALVKTSFVGISAAGLYQINLVVPTGLGQGDVPIVAVVGGMQTQAHVLFPLPAAGSGPVYSGGTVGSSPPPVFFTSGPPPGSSGGGGSGGGSQKKAKKHPYHPRLNFDPKQ